MAQEVAAKLEGEGISAAVINARFAKPIDGRMVEFYGRTVDAIVTMEDHVLEGGFGSAVLERLSDLGLQTPVIRIGWPDQFIEHGKAEVLRAKYGISVESTLQKVHRTFEQRAAEKPAHAVAKAQLG
jgi:1-deoxy-D-xylulose-5-phosphate synthase